MSPVTGCIVPGVGHLPQRRAASGGRPWRGRSTREPRKAGPRPRRDHLASGHASARRRAGRHHRRFGYRRIHVLLRREGWKVNHKRTYRLYRLEGLSVRAVRRRKRPSHIRVLPPAAAMPNERWSIDFVQDRLEDGRKFRAFTVPGVPGRRNDLAGHHLDRGEPQRGDRRQPGHRPRDRRHHEADRARQVDALSGTPAPTFAYWLGDVDCLGPYTNDAGDVPQREVEVSEQPGVPRATMKRPCRRRPAAGSKPDSARRSPG